MHGSPGGIHNNDVDVVEGNVHQSMRFDLKDIWKVWIVCRADNQGPRIRHSLPARFLKKLIEVGDGGGHFLS